MARVVHGEFHSFDGGEQLLTSSDLFCDTGLAFGEQVTDAFAMGDHFEEADEGVAVAKVKFASRFQDPGECHVWPNCPVVQVRQTYPDKPYEVELVITMSSGKKVERTGSGADGQYRVELEPGDYIVVPRSAQGSQLPFALPIARHRAGRVLRSGGRCVRQRNSLSAQRCRQICCPGGRDDRGIQPELAAAISHAPTASGPITIPKQRQHK